jgi:hypothetical protein
MKRFRLFLCLFLLFLLVVAGSPVAATSPSISHITPSSGPDNGYVTVTITGTGFGSTNGEVWMTPASVCEPSNKVYGTGCSWTSTSITCKFQLRGQTPLGYYTLWVRSITTDSLNQTFQNEGSFHSGFEIYKGSGTTYTTSATTAATGVTTTVTTAVTSGEGGNSVFFDINPSGAEIWLDGEDVGTGPRVYYTNRDGTYDVVVKKAGYEDYVAKVTIIRDKRVHFPATLTPLASGAASVTKPSSGTTVKNATTIRKSTLKIPTPLGTDPPVAEEAPADPAIALGAAGIAIGFVLLRRR